MDFCHELRLLEETLLDCQEKEGSLKEPSNDKKANAIIDFLKRKLENVLHASEATLRKVNLYLILNSDLIVRNVLLDDFDYGHLVNELICINGELLVRIVCSLTLQKYFCESIVLCPPMLSMELLAFTAKAMNSLDFDSRNATAVDLAVAIFMKINRIQHFLETTDRENVKHLYFKLYAYYATLVDYCLQINAEESADDPVVIGRRLMNILKLLKLCLRIYLEKDVIHSFDEYKIKLNCDSSDFLTSNGIGHMEFINHAVKMFLETSEKLTIGLWCDLCEFRCKDSERSYQQAVGEDSYSCLQLLNELNDQSVKEKPNKISNLISILPACAIKPYDEDDEIRNANIERILSNVSDKTKSQDKWLFAMLNFDNDAPILSREDCLLCLEQNITMMKQTHIDNVLEHITNTLRSHGDMVNVERLKELAIASIKHFSIEDQVKIVTAYFDKFGANTYLLTKDHNNKVIEVMNKAICISNDAKQDFRAEFIELFLQSPQTVLLRMLVEGLANVNQASLMTDILKILHPACHCRGTDDTGNPVKNNLIIAVLIELIAKQDWSEHELENFAYFVATLVSNSIMDNTVVLEECLFPAIHNSMIEHRWDVLVLFLRTVNQLIQTNTDFNIPAFLFVLGRVLDCSRCDLNNFNPQASVACEEASMLVSILIPRLQLQEYSDASMMWLRNQLTHLSPHNKSLFSNMFTNEEKVNANILSCDTVLFDIIHSKTTSTDLLENLDYSKQALQQFFVKFLPVLTCLEWKSLPVLSCLTNSNEDSSVWLLHILADSLMLICTIGEQKYRDKECAISCINYCLRNFASYIQDYVLPDSKSMPSKEVIKVFCKIVHLLERLPTAIRESCSIFFIMILVQLMTDVCNSSEGMDDNEQDSVLKELCSIIALSSVRQARIALAQKLSELFSN